MKYLSLVKQHYRLSSVKHLLLLDVIVITLFLIELFYNIFNTKIDFYNLFSLKYLNYYSIEILHLSILLLLLPLLISISRIIKNIHFPNHYSISKHTNNLSWVLYIHFILSLVIILLYIHSIEAKYLNGLEIFYYNNKPELRFVFISTISNIINRFIKLVFYSGSILSILYFLFTFFKDKQIFLSNYQHAANLLDLKSQYYPKNKSNKLNFISGAVSNSIEYIYHQRNQTYLDYDLTVPGSKASQDYAKALLEKTIKTLKATFFNFEGVSLEHIIFYPNTTRSFEVIIQNLGPNYYYILSPFEYPTIKEVLSFYKLKYGYQFKMLPFHKTNHSTNIDNQIENMLEMIDVEYTKNKMPIAFIISEVTYRNGNIIPLETIINRISSYDKMNDKGSVVIVDGCHSLGNIVQKPYISQVYAYFSSSHKWLQSPIPMGIVLSKYYSDYLTYDAWHESRIPSSYSDINALISLYTSLEFINRIKIESLRERRRSIKELLIKNLSDRFNISTNDESNIITIYPNDGKRWAYDNSDIVEKFAENDNIYLTKSFEYPTRLRLTIPYYLNYGDVIKTSKILKKRIV